VTLPLTNARVLVVEDDEDVRDLLHTLLGILGHEVREATNGEEALQILRDGWRPDLIVLDLMMPVMNGWAFRAEQRRIEGAGDIPVIVLSARRADGDLEAAEVLPKPFELDTFLAAVSKHGLGPAQATAAT
jgi:CheY-like chemotaxis protein